MKLKDSNSDIRWRFQLDYPNYQEENKSVPLKVWEK